MYTYNKYINVKNHISKVRPMIKSRRKENVGKSVS